MTLGSIPNLGNTLVAASQGPPAPRGPEGRYPLADVRRWRGSRPETPAGPPAGGATQRAPAGLKVEDFLEFAPDAILGVDESGRIVLVNRQAEAMFGCTRAELLGRSIETLVPERFRAVHAGHRGGYFRDPRTRPMGADLELFGLRRDGSEFPAEISLSSIRTADGTLAAAAVRDITRRVEAEHEREALRLELQHARSPRLESLGELAGGIAHDFNNLLAIILTYTGFAIDAVDGSPKAREDLGEVRRAAERAAELTRELLRFSRRERVKPEPVDVGEVVGGMVNMLQRTLGSHIKLNTRIDPELATVLADPGDLEQVIINLAVNARDAMPDGGRLTITAANATLDEHGVRVHSPEVAPGGYVELAVQDTGEGMSAATIARAFEPFYTTKPKGKGTGLGLATVYGIVRQAGGTVKIYSEPGRGTTVRAYLPITEEEPSRVVRDQAGLCQGKGETVLVVEDEDAVRRGVVRLLSANNYEVLEACSGTAALELCEGGEREIHLLLTDVIMPDMLGTQLVPRVQEARPGVRVLYMSGYMEPLGEAPDMRDDLIEKPFPASVLLQRVRDVLDGGAAAG